MVYLSLATYHIQSHFNHSVVRLVDGVGRCQGRVEHRTSVSNQFAQACDLNAGDSEAQVICRELSCDPNGARRVNPTKYISSCVNVHACREKYINRLM